MKKYLPLILILLMAITIIVIRQLGKSREANKPAVTDKNRPKDPASSVNRDRGFDRRTSYLEYSNHAKCRMKCRNINQGEVEEIMKEGKINYRKSDLQSQSKSGARCPRYAVEGRTNDDQRVRIVFAQCNESTVVVTVIDLDNEYQCDCPGDDNKYINRN